MKDSIKEMKEDILAKLQELEDKCDVFFSHNLSLLDQCESLQETDLLEVSNLETAERILKMVVSH